LIFSLMFSQVLFISSLSLQFSNASNLFEISIIYCFLNSSSFTFLRLNLSPANSVLLVYLLPIFLNFCNHQTVISITVSYPATSYIYYTRIPFPIYLYVINLVVSLPIRRGPRVLMSVSVGKHRALNN